MADDLLPPSIADPHRRQIGTRNVRARNFAGGRTEVYLREFPPLVTDEPKHRNGTDTAPTPLETVLGALCGCEGATIFYIAEAMRFEYSGVEFEGSSVVDLRGPRGVPGVRPYYESVDLKIIIYTDEVEGRVEKLAKNVEFRCPVMNLLRSADVKLTVDWETRPASQAPQPESVD
jgi:putative redox protein